MASAHANAQNVSSNPANLDRKVYDGYFEIHTDQAYEAARLLAKKPKPMNIATDPRSAPIFITLGVGCPRAGNPTRPSLVYEL